MNMTNASSFEQIIAQCGLALAPLDNTSMPELDADEVYKHSFEDVSLICYGQHDLGIGKLHTTSKRLIWVCGNHEAASVPFTEVSMHAISRDADLYKSACIYCQLDEPETLQQAGTEDAQVLESSRDLLLVPQDEAQVEGIFQALSEGAEANPDEMEADEGAFFFDEDEVERGMDADSVQRLLALENRLNLPSQEDMDGGMGGRASDVPTDRQRLNGDDTVESEET